MAGVARRLRKATKVEEAAIERMEKAGPRGEALRQLVRKHRAPQQWYDEDVNNVKPKGR